MYTFRSLKYATDDHQATLREERERLLAENKKLLDEKTTWTIVSATGEGATALSDEARAAWESEKAELIKARDDALAKVQVGGFNVIKYGTG